MTEQAATIFKSRVGRRVVVLFVVCTILPLWVLAELSVSQVRELLIDQGKTRLAAASRSYALAVHERLLNTHNMARLVVTQVDGPTGIPRDFADQYVFLGRADAAGDIKVIKGALPTGASRLVDEFRRLPKPQPALLRSLEGERLFLLVEIPGGRNRELLVGELNPAYVWGETDGLKDGTIICVVERTRMRYLHCPNGRGLDIPQVLANAGATTGATAMPVDKAWSSGGVSYRGGIWPQVMNQELSANDWYFTIATPEQKMLAALTPFRRNFMFVVALIVLLIAWVSIGQIRAMVIPLGRLTAGTRRIVEHKFGTQVKVGTDDEFGELAEAFNTMSTQLGRQFQISQAQAEIDRMILVRDNLENIVGMTLRQMQTLLPNLRAFAVLQDRVEPIRARRFSLPVGEHAPDRALAVEAVTVAAAERPDFAEVRLASFHAGDIEPAWSRGIELPGAPAQWVLPLVWGRTACGWLWIVGPQHAAITDDDQRILVDLAGRLALAVFSVWRDDELYHQAHFDTLTGLPNRLLFNDRLQREIARCKRESRITAVLFVDLDNFKSVNDSQGHSHGDLLLCEAARRISAALRELDTVSRHGGDEFTILLGDIQDQHDALRVGEAIISALSAPFRIDGQDSFLSASVGIAVHPEDGETAEDLLRNADIAMYKAKATGRAQALFFEERMNTETIARHAIKRELRSALANGEFELYFQPQISVGGNRVVAVEALLRWHHPQRGVLEPAAFMEVAEESGHIGAIGRWVIESACQHIASWREAGLALDRIAVNVSTRQLRDADFAEHIQRHVIARGFASAIEFEITETTMIDQIDLVTGKLKEISDAGCTIVLDDFGTGFSSLRYLKRLPVDVVKIDCSFILDIDKSAESLAFVESIIVMAHAMGKLVVAEGVENAQQARLLRELKCDLVQGYHFSRPLRLADLFAFIDAFHRQA